jgi:hypothetical protein
VKTEHVDAITRFLHRLRPGDVLLPIGAALITAGLQNLADREARGRGRLADLATLAADHLDALAAAGVEVPDELAVDELHPLDPEVPWLAQYASAEQEEETDPEERRRRRWKLAGLGLAAATGITLWNNRGRIFDRLGDILEEFTAADPEGSTFNEVSSEPVDKASSEPNAGRETPAAPWPTCTPDDTGKCVKEIHDHRPPSARPQPPDPTEPVDELDAVSVTPRESCGWPNCDWTSTPTKSERGQATQAAVHRNGCMYRPAGAGVTPA